MSDSGADRSRKVRLKFKTLAKVSARLMAPTANQVSRMHTNAQLHPSSLIAERSRQGDIPDFDVPKAVSARAARSHRSRSVPRQRTGRSVESGGGGGGGGGGASRSDRSRRAPSGPRSSSVPRRRPDRRSNRSEDGDRSARRPRRRHPRDGPAGGGGSSQSVVMHRSTPHSAASSTRSAEPHAWGGTASSAARTSAVRHRTPGSGSHSRGGRGAGTGKDPPPFRSASAAETRDQAARRDVEAARQSLLLESNGESFSASLDKFMSKLRQTESPALRPPPPSRRSASAEPLPSSERGGGGGGRTRSRKTGRGGDGPRHRPHRGGSGGGDGRDGGDGGGGGGGGGSGGGGVTVRSRAGVVRGRRVERNVPSSSTPRHVRATRPDTVTRIPRSSSAPRYAAPAATPTDRHVHHRDFTATSSGATHASAPAPAPAPAPARTPTPSRDNLRRVKAQVNVAMEELSSTRMALVQKAEAVQDMTTKINDLLSLVAGLLQVLMAQGAPPPSSALSGFPKAAQSALLETVLSPQTSINYPNESSIKHYIQDRLNHIETLLPTSGDAGGPPVPAPIATTSTASSGDVLSRISQLVNDASRRPAVPPSPTSYTSSPARHPVPPPSAVSSSVDKLGFSSTGATEDTLTATPPSASLGDHDFLPPFPTSLYGSDGPSPTTHAGGADKYAAIPSAVATVPPPPPPPPSSRPPAMFHAGPRTGTPPLDSSVADAIAASRQRLHDTLGTSRA